MSSAVRYSGCAIRLLYGACIEKLEALIQIAPTFTDEKDGIAVCEKNAYLLPRINAALKALREDGTIDKLRRKWTGGQ